MKCPLTSIWKKNGPVTHRSLPNSPFSETWQPQEANRLWPWIKKSLSTAAGWKTRRHISRKKARRRTFGNACMTQPLGFIPNSRTFTCGITKAGTSYSSPLPDPGKVSASSCQRFWEAGKNRSSSTISNRKTGESQPDIERKWARESSSLSLPVQTAPAPAGTRWTRYGSARPKKFRQPRTSRMSSPIMKAKKTPITGSPMPPMSLPWSFSI